GEYRCCDCDYGNGRRGGSGCGHVGRGYCRAVRYGPSSFIQSTSSCRPGRCLDRAWGC
ncbi:hypothetical protein KXV48_001490, partial [Aspergillus fumigatus]